MDLALRLFPFFLCERRFKYQVARPRIRMTVLKYRLQFAVLTSCERTEGYRRQLRRPIRRSDPCYACEDTVPRRALCVGWR